MIHSKGKLRKRKEFSRSLPFLNNKIVYSKKLFLKEIEVSVGLTYGMVNSEQNTYFSSESSKINNRYRLLGKILPTVVITVGIIATVALTGLAVYFTFLGNAALQSKGWYLLAEFSFEILIKIEIFGSVFFIAAVTIVAKELSKIVINSLIDWNLSKIKYNYFGFNQDYNCRLTENDIAKILKSNSILKSKLIEKFNFEQIFCAKKILTRKEFNDFVFKYNSPAFNCWQDLLSLPKSNFQKTRNFSEKYLIPLLDPKDAFLMRKIVGEQLGGINHFFIEPFKKPSCSDQLKIQIDGLSEISINLETLLENSGTINDYSYDVEELKKETLNLVLPFAVSQNSLDTFAKILNGTENIIQLEKKTLEELFLLADFFKIEDLAFTLYTAPFYHRELIGEKPVKEGDILRVLNFTYSKQLTPYQNRVNSFIEHRNIILSKNWNYQDIDDKLLILKDVYSLNYDPNINNNPIRAYMFINILIDFQKLSINKRKEKLNKYLHFFNSFSTGVLVDLLSAKNFCLFSDIKKFELYNFVHKINLKKQEMLLQSSHQT